MQTAETGLFYSERINLGSGSCEKKNEGVKYECGQK
jgi:hypothetical protein